MSQFVLKWSDKLHGTGIAEIDAQHQELFKRANALLQASSKGEGQTEVGSILEFLTEYVDIHFRCEEGHMIRRNCTGCAANKAAHAEFLRNFAALRELFDLKGSTVSLTLAVQRNVCVWLRDHVQQVDTSLREDPA